MVTKKTNRAELSPVLTLPEVAEFLKIHESTLYRRIQRRQIPFFRIGSDYRFIREELDTWRQSGGSNPTG